MQAKDVMTHPVISVSTRGSILEAVRLMLQHKISGLPVFDENQGSWRVSLAKAISCVGRKQTPCVGVPVGLNCLSVRASWQMNTSMRVHAR